MAADIKRSRKLIGLMLMGVVRETDYDQQELLNARSAFMLAVHKHLSDYNHPECRQTYAL